MLVGYEDPHFFSKIFKKHVGCSPKEHRQLHFVLSEK
jgi:YesN/AraC family two-component response regulator